MTGCPFDVGDVVVCVSRDVTICAGGVHHLGVNAPRVGAVARVASLEADKSVCDCIVVNGGGVHSRFRKIDADVTGEFREQLRAITKPKELARAETPADHRGILPYGRHPDGEGSQEIALASFWGGEAA